MGFKDWETPPAFFDQLDKQFHFTLDAAASHLNALCDRYSAIDGTWQAIPTGLEQLSPHDGLTQSWKGETVFCNPPYDDSLKHWVDKALKYEADRAVLLLPPSVDTNWFHKLTPCCSSITVQLLPYLPGWYGWSCFHRILLFKQGRIRFFRDGKPGDSPQAGNLLVIFTRQS